jgi:hypothetical protein
MDGRTVALLASLGLLAFLVFLIITVTVRNGFDPLLAFSLVIVTFLGIGVVGALTSPPPEE